MWSFPDNAGSATGKNPTRFLQILGNAIAVLIAVFPPVVYFYYSQGSLRTHLEVVTEASAHRVTDFINSKQDLWKYDEIRLRGILSMDTPIEHDEISRVRDQEGNILLEVGKTLGEPVITDSHEVMDAGRVVGKYERVVSLRPILRRTGWVALMGGFLGLAGLMFFKKVPLKSLLIALETIADERDRANITLESIGDCVIVTDTDGKILTLNRVGEKLTEWRREEARGKLLRDVFSVRKGNPEDAGEPSVRGLEEVRKFNRELLTDRMGKERIIDGAISPIYDRQNRHKGSVLVCRDVTEMVREEEEVFRARKLESIGLLAGGIAHDFNNILVGILGNVSLMRALVEPGTKLYGRIEEAEKASTRAKELSGKLLAFSKGGKPIRKLLSITDLVRDSATLAGRGSRSRIDFHLPETLWMAEADPIQIGQVISNLIINADQAMPDGGKILVEAENAVVADGDFLHVKRGEYLKIRVQDQGAGIPEEILEKVFDPYFTTKQHGSGIGLTTCYTIMKSHGGNIFVESNAGLGCTFTLFVPAKRNAVPPNTPGTEENYNPGTGCILFMDDEEMVLDVAAQMLSHLGYETVLARNGDAAVDIFKKAESGGKPFDLVILDLTIPGGIGGIEAARRIREIRPETKILVSSGYSNEPVMARCREHGFDGSVAKPYKIGELSEAIRTILSSAPVETAFTDLPLPRVS